MSGDPQQMTETININQPSLADLGLPESLLEAIHALGYTVPTPIQAQAIPPFLAGQDVLGQAQTGTGKTAAFALPLLANVQIKRRETQVLVLVPTRELALQVAEAFNGFAANMPGVNILAIYGGQGYDTQLRGLRNGAHIVIGTPGRVMDHMERGTLKLDGLKTLVLDEADEMLRMGFAENVQWILDKSPSKRQIGLFSATMPPAIKSITDNYLNNPQRITVKTATTTAATIRQCYWLVSNLNKLDALSRIIETEDTDAVIVFVRTKRATEELAEQLVARGFNAVAINGDIVQKQRERVIEQLKSGRIKILVATDVAARGIDVDKITHVINYDVPNNPESYTHRIGRTGRAGRKGTAILFISPKDKYMLRNIERATKQEIELMEPASVKTINERRVTAFKQRITAALTQDISFFENLLEQYITETEAPAVKVAAALAKMMQGDNEFLLKKPSSPAAPRESRERGERDRDRDSRPRGDFREKYQDRFPSKNRSSAPSRDRNSAPSRGDRDSRGREAGMEQYRVDIGGDDGLQPKNLVGAIANTAGIEGRLIGKIKIEAKKSFIDLPKGMPKHILQTLQRLKISGKEMNLQKVNDSY